MKNLRRWARNIGSALMLIVCIATIWLWRYNQSVGDRELYIREAIVDGAWMRSYVQSTTYPDGIGVGYGFERWSHPEDVRILAKLPDEGWKLQRSAFSPTPGPMVVGYRRHFGFDWTTLVQSNPTGYRSEFHELRLPFWFLVAMTAIGPLLFVRSAVRHRRRALRRSKGLCPTCGYDLRATPGRCPECGETESDVKVEDAVEDRAALNRP